MYVSRGEHRPASFACLSLVGVKKLEGSQGRRRGKEAKEAET